MNYCATANRHPRESGGPGATVAASLPWISAFAEIREQSRYPKKARDKLLDDVAAKFFSTIVAVLIAAPVLADEEPKHGGSLTYMIPADAPPSFDGHRESTYATVHSV